MTPIIVKAPAKINLSLSVVQRFDNGYHHLQSLITFLESEINADIITLSPSSFFTFQANLEEIKSNDNIIVKATEQFCELYSLPLNVDIHLEKKLPIQAGIGGGSSDAAATLYGLCQFYNIPFDRSIYGIAVKLGADVPLCLDYFKGHRLLWLDGSGLEAKTTPVTIKEDKEYFMVLITPQERLSTPQVFKTYRELGCPFSKPIHFQNAIIGKNDLLNAALFIHPSINEIIQYFEKSHQNNECLYYGMSGSGSTFWAIFECENQAQLCKKLLKSLFPQAWIACGLCFVK